MMPAQTTPGLEPPSAGVGWESRSGNPSRSTACASPRVNVKRLYSWKDRTLFGFADSYGPVFLYDPSTGVTAGLGRPQFSLYDATFGNGKTYLSGYPAATLEYDPSRPWSLTGSTPLKSSPAVNPHYLPVGFGKYHYYSCFGADGMVYVAAHHERDSTGGELGWYDPATGAKGSLRAPFLTHDVRDLKPALGATKLVCASNHEKLFVFDVATKAIERTITPLPGIGPLDCITEVKPGIILGAVKNFIYQVNIRDGSILYTNTLPGLAFGGTAVANIDHRMTTGPDGFVWLFIGNSLYRIDPASASLQKVLDTPAKSLCFLGNDLYLYGGPNLQRIRGILASAEPGALRGER
jgi:hypothetical protein